MRPYTTSVSSKPQHIQPGAGIVRSKLDCAVPAWQPGLSASNICCLDHLQTCNNQLNLKPQENPWYSTNSYLKRVIFSAGIPQSLQNCYSFLSQVQRSFYSCSSWTWASPNHQTFFISTMAVKRPFQGRNFLFCSWYRWSGWWHWFKTMVQSHTHCIIPGLLHHLHRWIH